MSQADWIRQIALESYILPARAAGQEQVVIRAGDLHSAMKLKNAMPAVCSALHSEKFESFAGVTKLDVSGPANGANVYFRFAVTPSLAAPARGALQREAPQHHTEKAELTTLDLSGAVVLVSCVKSKLPKAAPARLLYCSDWFTKVRNVVEPQGVPWFVLSALHGLVPADKEIAPYELTLNTMGVADRRAWADSIYRTLVPELQGHKRVVFLAGLRYREFLVAHLERDGWEIEVPMEGLTIGQQLSWLSAR